MSVRDSNTRGTVAYRLKSTPAGNWSQPWNLVNIWVASAITVIFTYFQNSVCFSETYSGLHVAKAGLQREAERVGIKVAEVSWLNLHMVARTPSESLMGVTRIHLAQPKCSLARRLHWLCKWDSIPITLIWFVGAPLGTLIPCTTLPYGIALFGMSRLYCRKIHSSYFFFNI